MVRGKKLSDYERGVIAGLISSGLTHTEIGKRINRSQNVVSNYLRDRDRYVRKYKTGRPSVVNERDKRQLLNDVVNKGMSIMESKRANQFSGCKTTYWNVLNKSEKRKILKTITIAKIGLRTYRKTIGLGAKI